MKLNLWLRCWMMMVAMMAIVSWGGNAHANPNYAAFVVSGTDGKVLFDRHSTAERHPASLTKVMTIYLVFEALQSRRLGWDSQLPVSEKAASAPQTNIGLMKGDRITVRDAVEALVVRSANDVAVVVAEALGKTEWNFGVQMTQKARALGMRNTVFKNASGLHHPQQVTTARDMALLAVAIQRDFPQYFNVFSTTTFRYKGRSYASHNRVKQHLDGATGLKTGFIRASGFNLITTAKRGNDNLIGVVMGGRSSQSRDNHMVQIMNDAFRSARQGVSGTVLSEMIIKPAAGNNMFAQRFDEESYPTPVFKQDAAQQAVAVQDNPFETAYLVAPSNGSQDMISGNSGSSEGWMVQVGTFSDAKAAAMAAAHAISVASPYLQNGLVTVVGLGRGETSLHRARIANLNELQARQACEYLTAASQSCFAIAP